MLSDRDLNTFHLFDIPQRLGEWKETRLRLKERVALACGLLPEPEKCPLQPNVTHTFEADGVRIENVAIQTIEGFWLCGNIYRPLAGKGPFPAIANPHGHWSAGRFTREQDVPPNPKGERLAYGKADFVQLGVSLARQGFIVFAYDMVGYGETKQAGHTLATGLDAWCWGISLLGVQTWNSIRAIDYLVSRPDVDSKRIGVTGASGGGTQAFILAALDERIQCSVPVNMVSSTMQGGCLCENAPGLRVDTDNVEIAALFAPRPQLVVSCLGDWSKTTPTVEGPAMKRVYDLFGSAQALDWVQFPYEHNYNRESREAMTRWMCKWLKPTPSTDVSERETTLDTERLRVFPKLSKSPQGVGNDEEFMVRLRKMAIQRRSNLLRRGLKPTRKWERELRSMLSASVAVSVPKVTPGTLGPVTLVCGRSACDVAASLPSNGISVSELHLSDVKEHDWKEYHSTYNQTAFGNHVAVVVAAWKSLQSTHAVVNLVAAGDTASVTLVAAGLIGSQLSGKVIVDVSADQVNNDRYWSTTGYAPSIRVIGDINAAAMLVRDQGVILLGVKKLQRWPGLESHVRREPMSSQLLLDLLLRSQSLR